jgi:TonB family protein
MIPRTLVPVDVRPVKDGEAKIKPRRLETYMDDRTVVPSGLSDAPPLDGKTTIPAHFPLGVLVHRTLVPRGMPAKTIERRTADDAPSSIAVLDERMVVPPYVEPLTAENIKEFEIPLEMTPALREVVEPDIFNTGDANLLIEPTKKRDTKEDLLTRVLSVAAHVILIIFLISIPKLFPPHIPTQEELDMARKELPFVYLPPVVSEPPAPAPRLRMNRNTLNKVAPPIEKPAIEPPAPTPERPAPDLPEAPKPRIPVTPAPSTVPVAPSPSRLEPVLPANPTPNGLNLHVPRSTPGKSLDDQLNDAIRQGRHQGGVYSGGGGGAGQGGPGMGYGAQILTDTQGVDFGPYIQRLLASLKRNWEFVMPESARMGEKGAVYTSFQINKDGSVPNFDPLLDRTSGKDPLDNAAMSAIHASNPFEPLPTQFKGPSIRIRIVFLYNLHLEDVQ